MGRNRLNLRFGVRRTNGFVSSVWRLWITNAGDVYLSTRSMASIVKYSFHVSGICRRAFAAEHGTPVTMADRLIYRWRRAPTASAGAGHGSRVLWLAVPTDFLSRHHGDLSQTQVRWIPAAP